MRFGVRARLFLTYLALVVVVLGASGFFLAGRLVGNMRQQIAEELLAHARQVRWLLEETRTSSSTEELQRFLVPLGKAASARITVIAADGTVLGDSDLTASEVSRLENHGKRPEVLEAQQTGHGSAIRYSTTIGADMMYTAVACQNRSVCGTVRTARSLQAIDNELGRMLRDLGLTLAGGVALALLLGFLAASLVASPLRHLVKEAHTLLAGVESQGPATTVYDLKGIAVSIRRLTAEMQATVQELGRQRDLFRAVLESMQEGVLVLDGEMRVTHVNPAAAGMLGNGRDMVEKPLLDVVRVPELHELGRRALAGEEGEREFEQVGQGRRLQAHAAPLKKSPGALVVLRDVTELRRLETVRKDFVANVAHELRTPLSVIRAAVETLLSGALERPERAREFAESALRSTERLSRLVEDLLDLSRLESGKFHPELGPVKVAATGGRVIEELRPAAEKKNIALAVAVPEDVSVLSWSEGLEQVLFNLLDNAVKYGEPGGKVELRAEYRQERVRIEVRDSGPGIEPQHMKRLFERFYRVDKGRSRELGGTGLGLAIVKHLTESMGGRVGVEPNSPHGSIFWVELRRPEARHDAQVE